MKEWFKRTFIPHEGNDFQPHALQKAALVGITALVLISFSIANLQSILWFSSEWLVSTILPAVVTDATNSARAVEGRAPLQRSESLDEAARLKAEDMAAKGYFAHWSPDGVSPWHWFEEVGYRYLHAGENLAVHFTDSTEVVEAWMDSPTHRDNIMNGSYTEIGIGTAIGEYEGYDTVFVVQMFGSPVAAAPATAPTEVPEEVVIDDQPVEATAIEPVVAGAGTAGTISVIDNGTVVYESFAATAAPEAAQVISSTEGKIVHPPSTLTRLLTSPRMLLQIAYTIIGLMVLFILSISIILEWRRHHPVQLAYASALLFFMIILFQVHMLVSSGATIS